MQEGGGTSGAGRRETVSILPVERLVANQHQYCQGLHPQAHYRCGWFHGCSSRHMDKQKATSSVVMKLVKSGGQGVKVVNGFDKLRTASSTAALIRNGTVSLTQYRGCKHASVSPG
jgi:hypothetical protein